MSSAMPSLERSIQKHALPPDALLRKYVHEGAYTDCFATQVHRQVSLAEYVEAFYTTGVFKLERWILAWSVGKPSSDADARGLALGELGAFSAWSVEGRESDQLLMCDFIERTRSWLMVAPLPGGAGTRLYFGSAVVPVRDRSGALQLGSAYASLMGFHELYSRILLRAASSRLERLAHR